MTSHLVAALLLLAPPPSRHFTITVVDEQTGRGVPLVELRTVHGVRLVTDSAGVAVFDEPGLLGHTVFFHVSSHGYVYPADGFGYRGKALRVVAGGGARLTVQRINIAERLYRVTGAGIYRDSILAGRPVPIRASLLNGQVLGCDSVVNAAYRGKLYWFYGDTNRPSYPLGNFNASGATSLLPARGGLDPEEGIDLRWFVDEKGFARSMAPMPGKGPTWLTSLVVLPGAGRERMYASYVKVEPPLKVHARGLAVFNDEKEVFEHLADIPMSSPAFPEGHSFLHREGGVEYVYFAHPYPLTRVRASAESLRRPDRYETYTCLKEGSTPAEPRLDRDREGRLRYAWRKGMPAVGPAAQAKLVAAGALKPHEGLLQLRDRDTGKRVQAHSGSVYWNPWRKRWVLIAVQVGGSTSLLGEVWYAEADTPAGPWAYAVKVVSHHRYSFYNPRQHPLFDKERGRVIFFEGTYTHTFSGNPDPTPRYDYNQVLYRLDLADPRVALPVAVYELTGREGGPPFGTCHLAGGEGSARVGRAAFFALDRPVKGLVPVRSPAKGDGTGALRVGAPWKAAEAGEGEALFYALPAEGKDVPEVVPLYEHVPAKGGRRVYSTLAELPASGYRRAERPVCRVWRSPHEP